MIEIRACQGLGELEACVQLQLATWGYDLTDAVPRRLFLLAQKIGGQVIGAFETGSEGAREQGRAERPPGTEEPAARNLVGFAMSLPGVKIVNSQPYAYLHSHMLAVRESHRNRGIGTQLKWEQRREALSRGIRRMEWTFDPLEIKNAFLNIHRLGAIACEYRVDFYGVSSSRLQGGLPTDRLLAVWELDSPRVEGVAAHRPAGEHSIQERIIVPVSIGLWKANEANRKRALAVQLEIRKKLQRAFSQGLAVLGYSRDSEGNGVFELGLLPR